MDSPAADEQHLQFMTRLPSVLQWALILLVSAILTTAIAYAGLPAAMLIGPMLAGVIAGMNGATVRIPKPVFAGGQAIIGILIAGSIQPAILAAFIDDWPLFMFGVLSTVAASSYLGWQISRWKVLPGTTAVWGSAPGAATAMVLMADAFGADYRLVAFMQYLRVIVVAIVAAIIAGLFVDEAISDSQPQTWFPALDWPSFMATVVVASVGAGIGGLLRLPSPFFLGSMILGVALHLGAGVSFQLPPWLLSLAYGVIGWSIGLSFTREIVRHAARAFAQVLGSIFALILFCAGTGYILSHLLGIDMLTAYLATSPGGMDSVAIIAAASEGVNLSFILAMQMGRFLFVLVFGPSLAKLIARAVKD